MLPMFASTNIVLSFTALLGFLFAGCSIRQHAPAPPGFVKTETRFDYAEHEPYAKNGENGMSGRSLINEQGNVVTCAGNRVLLLPGTDYFQEMIAHITAGSEPLPPQTPYPSLKGMIRKTQ